MRKQILLCVLATALFFVGLPPLALAGDGPTVTITSLTPTLTSKTNQVRVRIQVKNPGAEPLREQTAAVSVMAASPLDANELAAWLRGSGTRKNKCKFGLVPFRTFPHTGRCPSRPLLLQTRSRQLPTSGALAASPPRWGRLLTGRSC